MVSFNIYIDILRYEKILQRICHASGKIPGNLNESFFFLYKLFAYNYFGFYNINFLIIIFEIIKPEKGKKKNLNR